MLKAKVYSTLFLALLLAQPVMAATYPINVAYGRSWPLSVVVDSARGLAYVDATSGEYPPTGFSFGVINTTTHEVVSVLGLPVVPGPMALDRGSGDVYIAGSDSIAVYDGGSRNFTSAMAVGRPILDMAHDGNVSGNIFFTSGNGVFALDPQTEKVTANATVANGPNALVLDPTNGRLYVSEYLAGEIAVFQASTLAPLGVVRLPACCAAQLALDTRTQMLYASTGSNYVDLVNAAADSFVVSLKVAPSPENSTNEIAVDSETGRVYVASTPGGSIIVLDGKAGIVTGALKAQTQVAGLAVDERTHELYATNYHQVTVFDVASARPLLLLAVGGVVLAMGVVGVYLFARRRAARERRQTQASTKSGRGPREGRV